jgi:predicted thioredoxin/glutaredoxin
MKFSSVGRFAAILLIPALLSNSEAFAARKPVDPVVIKAKVQGRGVGQGIRVKLADNTDVKGLIVSIGKQSFAVKSKDAEKPVDIEYAQVTSVHNQKMTTGQKVGIGVAIFGAAVVITAAIVGIEFERSWGGWN